MILRKAIVIGATSGIGRALAILLAEDGYHVGITGRREELLTELQDGMPGKFIPAAFDVSSPDAAERTERLIADLDGLDLLIYCSGTGDENPGLDIGIEDRTNTVNVESFTRIVTLAYRHFAA